MNAISSYPSLMNFRREGISVDGLFKRYAILFDQIIFNRHLAPVGDPGFGNLAEFISLVITPKGAVKERQAIGKNKKFADLFVDCWDVVQDAEKFELNRFSIVNDLQLNSLRTFPYEEVRKRNNLDSESAFDIDEVRILSGDLYSDIGLNLLAVKEGLNVVPNYSPIIGRALTNEINLRNGQSHEIFNDGLLIPDFDSFSWDEILELRQDHNVKAFRKVALSVMESGTSINYALQKQYNDDFFKLAEDVRPSKTQSILTGIVTNLPSPLIINPIAVALSMKDVRDNIDRESKYGHVYFIQGMRQLRSN